MHRVSVTRGLVGAASLVLSILAACSLTASPGDYAQGGDVDAAPPRPPVPPGGARVLLLAGQRDSADPREGGWAIKETMEAIVQADGTIGNFFYDRAPPVETTDYAQAMVDNGRLLTTALVRPRVTGGAAPPRIAFAPIDTASGAVTSDWSLLDVDGSVPPSAGVLLVRPSTLVAAGGTESVATADGGTETAWTEKVFTTSVDLEGRKTGGWTESPGGLSVKGASARLFVHKDFLYAVGGRNEGGLMRKVDVARLDAAGKPGAFAATAQLPGARALPEVASGAGKLFVVGGIAGAEQRVNAKLFVAPINEADGTLGEWTEGPPMPKPLALGALLFHKDKLYYFGGIGQTEVEGGLVQNATDTIFVLDVAADGTLGGAWREIGKLPAARGGLAAVVLP